MRVGNSIKANLFYSEIESLNLWLQNYIFIPTFDKNMPLNYVLQFFTLILVEKSHLESFLLTVLVLNNIATTGEDLKFPSRLIYNSILRI